MQLETSASYVNAPLNRKHSCFKHIKNTGSVISCFPNKPETVTLKTNEKDKTLVHFNIKPDRIQKRNSLLSPSSW